MVLTELFVLFLQLCKGHTVVLHVEEVPEDTKLQAELYDIVKHMLASLHRYVCIYACIYVRMRG